MKVTPHKRAARQVFSVQRWSAKKRGVEFLFTFEEWFTWWETKLGPDWLKKRGRKRGQFVMARDEDEGPYAPWNVSCITAEENCKQRKINGTAVAPRGENSPKAKLTNKEVIRIFRAKKSLRQLSRDYDMNAETIRMIKNRKNWKHITDKLDDVAAVPVPHSENHKSAKLSNKEVVEIFFATGTLHQIGKEYNISMQTIWAIKNRVNWKHVTARL